jgi:hypothetical protein
VLYSRLRRRAPPGGPPAAAEGPAPGGLIPERLWSDLLLLAFRLSSGIPGFSYAAHAADFDPAKPEGLMDRVLHDAEALHRRVHAELFAREERDREIARACDEVLGELTRRELGVMAGGTTKTS